MSPADLKDFTPPGREQLRRILQGVLETQRLAQLASPELVTRAVEQGRGLELVRHLEALRKDGGR